MNPALKSVAFVLAFVVTLLAADRAGGAALGWVYQQAKDGEAGGKINRFLELGTVPEITILGNSRAAGGIVPEKLSHSAFNLAHNGTGFAFQAGLLSVLQQRRRVSPLLVVNVDPNAFLMGDDSDVHDLTALQFYYGRNPLLTDYLNDVSTFERFKYLFSLYRFNGAAVNIVGHAARTAWHPPSGTGEKLLPVSPRDSVTSTFAASRVPRIRSALNKAEFGYLNDFIQVAELTGAHVVAVTPPYLYADSARGFWDAMSEAREALRPYLAQHNVDWLDYSLDTRPTLKDPALWHDAVHFNEKGARIFSQLLAEDIRLLQWRRKPGSEKPLESSHSPTVAASTPMAP